MKNIIVVGPYLPGMSFGGPVKSILNMVNALSDVYNFYVLTGDRDLKSNEVFQGVNIGKWNKIGKVEVLYIPKNKEFKFINSALQEIDHDLVYVSSFFSKKTS
jgi:hypothetical protein